MKKLIFLLVFLLCSISANAAPFRVLELDYATPPTSGQYVKFNGTNWASATLTIPMGTTITGGTKGSVLFIDPDATLAQDNQNFYWDNTADRLDLVSTLGSEKVSNGTFTGSASGWTVGSGYTYSSNTVVHSSNGTASLQQNVSVTTGRIYTLTYTISAWTVGTVTPSLGGTTGTAVGANGTYTERLTAVSTGNLQFNPTNTSRFTIDNISVKELTGGTLRAGTIIGGNSGELRLVGSGGNGVAFYTSPGSGLYSYNFNGGFYNSGWGNFGSYGVFGGYAGAYGGVHAGSTSSPTSTLQSAGSTALKVVRLTTNTVLNGSERYTVLLCDGDTATSCTGTPTYSCNHWTNSIDCALYDAHGGCTWFAGTSCSVFNGEYGMYSCASYSGAGCTVDTNSCAGPGDYYSCVTQNDSYGGSCDWIEDMPSCAPLDEYTCGITGGCSPSYFDCTTLNGNDSGCSGHAGCSSSGNPCPSYTNTSDCNGNGCSAVVDGDCSTLSDGGGDGTLCATQPECSYDFGSGVCSNLFFTSCTGDTSTCSGMSFVCNGNYSSYSCHNNYNNGNCSGTYGAACQGTSTCGGIDDSVNCGLEVTCAWATGMQLTLPNGESYPDRIYFIKNDSAAGADIHIYPYSGQTVEKASSYTLANNSDGITLAYYKHTKDCSVYVSAGTCTPSGCTINNSNCSYDMGSTLCTGNAVCPAHDGDQSGCESQSYFSSCSGTETVYKNWYKLGYNP